MDNNYLEGELSTEEKVYLKKVVISSKKKYLNRNKSRIDFELLELDLEFIDEQNEIEKIDNKIDNTCCISNIENIVTDIVLYKIIKGLTKREKSILFYLYVEEKTMIEISKILNIDRGTVRRINNRIINKILDKLKEEKNEKGNI